MAVAENGVARPRFFRIFLSETSFESMEIPMSVSEHLEDPLPKTAKLLGTGGGIWTVSFTKTRQRAYFTAGWSKFAEDHDLKDGEVLTFVYDGHHTFEVSVYNRWGSKETRAVKETVELSDSDSDSGEEEEEEPSVDGGDDTDSDFAVVAENSHVEVTTNPCFTTSLKKRIHYLLVPANVIRDHGLTFGESIMYVDEEGTMVGERGRYSDNRIVFKGWDRICRRNKVREHDQVKCEMLHSMNFVHSIKIHVTRG